MGVGSCPCDASARWNIERMRWTSGCFEPSSSTAFERFAGRRDCASRIASVFSAAVVADESAPKVFGVLRFSRLSEVPKFPRTSEGPEFPKISEVPEFPRIPSAITPPRAKWGSMGIPARVSPSGVTLP